MNLLKYGDTRLESKASGITGADDIYGIKSELKSVFSKYPKAQGLSAPQIGISKRVSILRVKGKEFFIVNPVIEFSIGKRSSVESCMSTDKKAGYHDYYMVKRPFVIIVSYTDELNRRVKKLIGPKLTRLYCHEIDHYDGKLIDKNGRFFFRCKITT